METDIEQAMAANRRNWDERVPIHAASRSYDVDGFKAGKSSLLSIELEEMGDVTGKSLLHLQCHFGLDTMSWARLGARATGVDFSEKAIDLARSLSKELSIDARFVFSNVYDLPAALDEAERYDIVFTSYGVLCWLPELPRWAEIIAHYLRPGGTFYMVDGHPFGNVFYDGEDATDLTVHYPYFHSEPMRFEPGPTYAAAEVLKTHTYQWCHPMSDILNSLVSAGLTIRFLHEFPFSGWRSLPMMQQGEDGWWRFPEFNDSVPQLFSLRATKPA